MITIIHGRSMEELARELRRVQDEEGPAHIHQLPTREQGPIGEPGWFMVVETGVWHG